MVPEVAEEAEAAEVVQQVTYPLLIKAPPTSRELIGTHTRWATIITGQIWNV